MRKIIQSGHKTLRETANEVPFKEIGGEKIKNITEEMINALNSTKDGVALAAPQIGIPLKIFIVYKIYADPKITDKMADKEKTNGGKKILPNEFGCDIYINPKIIKISKKKQTVREGCLSVMGIFGTMNRAEKITIEAYNEKGEKLTRGASGLLAQIFQHEIDHLNGVLFTDTAVDLEKINAK